MMQSNESNRDKVPDRHRGTDSKTNGSDEPDHDVPVAEQLTERQRKLVGRDGGGDE